ncbi:MAG: 50S ribosomal protein L5 [Candidatus Omnitrophica bacterium]|nr:50S ribosomal protein L5 [Candidatus Omnitrophota bacterium]
MTEKTAVAKAKSGVSVIPRLLTYYRDQMIPKMMEKFGYRNVMEVPRLEKIIVNMGIGEGAQDIKRVDSAVSELALITGQHPVVTRAKKAISNFKIRKGDPVGCKVTLRSKRMYEFLDRLVSIALPRIRDFRGLSLSSFDGRGNYAFGLNEQIIFPEIEYDKVQNVQGMDVIIATTASNKEETKELLTLFGIPFRKS